MLKVKFKKTNPNAVIPTYAKHGDAGMDLTAVAKDVVDKGDHGYVSYDFGIAVEIPEGYVGLIFPRSSISKTGMILSNSVGVIDSGYRGSVSARFKHVPNTADYNVGDKIAQLVIMPYPQIELEEVTDLSSTDRGAGGYGSTTQQQHA